MASTSAAIMAEPSPARAVAAPSLAQLLSFVFASADMVLEIRDGETVDFATGAAVRLLGRSAESVMGRPWREMIEAADAELIEAALREVLPGERKGPFLVSLAATRGPQAASLTLFQMPQREGRVAVAISLRAPGAVRLSVNEAGLANRDEFEAAAASLLKQAEIDGAKLQVDLLEFAGLTSALAAMSATEAMDVRRKLAASLQASSYGGLPAAALGPDRFAMLRAGGGASTEALAQRARELAGPRIQVWAGALPLDEGSPAESLRAIRYAIDRCIDEGPGLATKTFEAALRQTVNESSRFKELIRDGRFELVYQPVMELKSRTLHHYEALTRFDGGDGPGSTIKLAEELGLVVELDRAIVRTVYAALCEARDDIRIAANISAVSLEAPGFVDELLDLTAPAAKLRPRLILELTESHKIADLGAANAQIQRLRGAGHVLCLDDFGSGAASLDYLREIDVDVVKFDGRFVQALGPRPRAGVILGRMTDLCRELGVKTVAEMIESEETARLVADLGVDLGQGWLFGKPVTKPEGMTAVKAGPLAARRRGEVETWG